MKSKLVAGCAALCAAIALAGCASLNRAGSSDLLRQIDANFAGCERHVTFQGSLGAIMPGAQVSGSIDCKASPGVSPPAEPMRP